VGVAALLAVALSFFQAPTENPQTPPAEERIVLDAAEKRITRAYYRDEKAISVRGAEAGGWHLEAGATIEAQHIDLRMLNVRGVITYRADWSRISDLLNRATGTRRAKP
jgi:hypothetical protein